VDDVLNQATDGQWENVLQGYARDTNALNEAKAAAQVRGQWWEPGSRGASDRVRGTAGGILGVVPNVTESSVDKVLRKVQNRRGQSMLSSEAESGVQSVLDALRAQNVTQRVKNVQTGMGGSNTAGDLASMLAGDSFMGSVGKAVKSLPVLKDVSPFLNALGGVATHRQDALMAQALQNPQAMLALLERAAAQGEPLSQGQRLLLQALRSTGSAATVSAH